MDAHNYLGKSADALKAFDAALARTQSTGSTARTAVLRAMDLRFA
jgi:hypothetical protein